MSMIGTSMSWGTPTTPTTEPGRAIAIAVPSDWPVPTHSRAASTPTPSVSSRTAWVASSPPLGEDVGGTERARQGLAGRVPAEGDDPGRAEAPGGDDRAQAHGAVPDHGDDRAGPDARAHRRVVARGHDIGEREQRTHRVVRVAGAGDPDEGASGK